MELWVPPDEAYTSGDADGRSPISAGRVLSIIEERYPERDGALDRPALTRRAARGRRG